MQPPDPWQHIMRRCRICWQSEEFAKDKTEIMIAPCKCKGSVRWVHQRCLRNWRASQQPSDSAFSSCLACSCAYRFRFGPVKSMLTSELFPKALAFVLTAGLLILGTFLITRFWELGAFLEFEPPSWRSVVADYTSIEQRPTRTGARPLAPLECLVACMALVASIDFLFVSPHLLLTMLHGSVAYAMLSSGNQLAMPLFGMSSMYGTIKFYSDLHDLLQTSIRDILLDHLSSSVQLSDVE